MDDSQIRTLTEVQQLAEEYASYSMSKNGLGNVLGGIVGIAIFLENRLLGRGIWTTVLTISLTLVWLVGKEVIRKRLYRVFGEAREPWSVKQWREHRSMVALLLLSAVGVWILIWWAYLHLGTISVIGLVLGLAFATSMPLVFWRYLRTTDEMMVGVFLLLCCAIASMGFVLGGQDIWGWLSFLWVPLYSLIMLGKGLQEHRKFGQLARQLRTHMEEE